VKSNREHGEEGSEFSPGLHCTYLRDVTYLLCSCAQRNIFAACSGDTSYVALCRSHSSPSQLFVTEGKVTSIIILCYLEFLLN
jgi:hypothetical protein